MSVIINDIVKDSIAYECGIKKGDLLISIDGNEIMDVLDYRFYQNSSKLTLCVLDNLSNEQIFDIEKDEFEELGLLFDTYLMDKKRSCSNKCIFCFIDQLPKGLRKSLYFKDDDSRLSFLFGNYITLTNITEHEIERIIKMHISPINISVHTTNPELRVKMMNNKNAGKALEILYRLNDAGIVMNSQLVLCPGFNDGEELERTLKDLSNLSFMQCVACVPVGLTKFREGLTELKPFDKQGALNVLNIIEKYAEINLKKYGSRRFYASDEFYLLAQKEIPSAEFYGDFAQLENGVGLWALLKSEADEQLDSVNTCKKREISAVTGVAAYPLIKDIALSCEKKFKGLKINLYSIKNDFFGEKITVAGLITATDIINQLSGKELGEELIVPDCMLRDGNDMFLDSITVEELENKLNVKVKIINTNGYDTVNAFCGIKE